MHMPRPLSQQACIPTCLLLLLLPRRWMNLHVMRMQPGSELTHRVMRLATLLPLDHPRFQQEVMDKHCKPAGYMTVSSCCTAMGVLLLLDVTLLQRLLLKQAPSPACCAQGMATLQV